MNKANEDPCPLRDLENSVERLELQRGIEEAEQDIAAGNWVEHSEIIKKLKQWVEPASLTSLPEDP